MRVKGVRWWMISLVMLGCVVNYLARSTLGVAAPTMMADLKMSAAEYSYVLTGFKVAYLAQPLAGYVLDVIGIRIAFALFALLWSVIAIAHGLVSSWPQLLAVRTLLGFPEASVNPAGVKATAEWFPARERGLAGGIYNVGASLGAMIAPPLIAWAILTYHWQFAFVITGAVGVVWAALFYAFYRSPGSSRVVTAEELAYIRAGQESFVQSDGTKPKLRQIVRNRNFWGIAIPRFFADPTWTTLSFWVPLYLINVRHMDLAQIAMFAWLPFLAADFGSIVSGALAAWLIRTFDLSAVNARRWTFTAGACLMLGLPFAGYVQSSSSAIALLCLAGFAHQILSVSVITMASDLFRRNEVATAAGSAGTLSGFGSLSFGLVVGAMVTSVGYAPFFVLLGLFDVIGAIVLWTFVRDPAHGAKAPDPAAPALATSA